MSASVVNCPSCGVEFELDVENPYESPKSDVRRRTAEAEAPKFPTICMVMSIVIICIEVLRLIFAGLAFIGLKVLEEEALIFDPAVKTAVYVFMAIMITLAFFGIICSSLTIAKKKVAIILNKIYIFLALVGICFSFVSFNLQSIIINGVITVFLIISVINYSSWWRQCDQLKKLARKRSRGQQTRRPAGRLKRRRA